MNDACRSAVGIVAAWLGDVPDVQKPFGEGSPSCSTWDAMPLHIEPDYFTLGVLVLYVTGKVADWVDLIISDLALPSLTEQRAAELEAELGSRLSVLEVARKVVNRAHAEIPGSSSFTIIRFSKVGSQD